VSAATYPPLGLAFPDRRDWIFSAVLAHRARQAPARPFLQYATTPPLTYGEVDRRVHRLAHGLRALGVAPGDRVLVMLPTSIEFLLVWWAANRIGAVEVSVNNAYKGYFLAHHCRIGAQSPTGGRSCASSERSGS